MRIWKPIYTAECRRSKLALLLAATSLLAACETAGTIRMPLSSGSVTVPAAHVDLDDRRPQAARDFHYGKRLLDCERWYGDSSFDPSKAEFLRQQIAAKVAPPRTVKLTLDRLDTIEYCEDSSSRGAAAAAMGASAASGFPVYMSGGVPGGDRFELRIEGMIDGQPFSLKRVFGYSDIRFLNLPGETPEFRERLRKAFESAAEEILSVGR